MYPGTLWRSLWLLWPFLRGVVALFRSEHLQQVAAISLRSPSDLLKSPFFRSFAVRCPVAPSWGFAVKGVTLYPGIFARPLLALWLVSVGVRSLGCISEHATAFRSHSLPAPLPVLHLSGLHGMPLQLHTMPILAVFVFSWVLLRLGAQTARPAVCGRCLMPLKVAAACIMHHLAIFCTLSGGLGRSDLIQEAPSLFFIGSSWEASRDLIGTAAGLLPCCFGLFPHLV